MDAICLHDLALALKAGSWKVVLVDITFLTDQLAVLAAALAWWPTEASGMPGQYGVVASSA